MNNTQRIKNCRSGISLVEVLTSIVIALIGVAGVLVLIPFGIRQAEIGLDIDDSITMADNALARFEIEGYRRVRRVAGDEVLPWITRDDTLVDVANPTGNFYIIDPLWTGANTAAGAARPVAAFYNNIFVDQGSFPAPVTELLPEFVTLLDGANPVDAAGLPNSLPFGLAARMFLNSDDLQFATDSDPTTGLPLDGVDPPVAYIDVAGATGLRRQSRGELSWSAMAVPSFTIEGAAVGQTDFGIRELDTMEFYMLIYKDRSFANPADYANGILTDADFDPRLRLATVDSNETSSRYANNVFLSGGSVPINAAVAVSNDDWVMMANVNPITGIYQAGLYRVTGSNPAADVPTISLDGPSFIFDDPADGSAVTIIIHLTNVVNVYRRTITLERDSIFNGG